MTVVSVDVAYEDDEGPIERVIETMTKDYEGISATLIEERGPGGGWPVVKFQGPETELVRMLEDHGYVDGIDTYRAT
jgi:hypothetical protein